MNKNYIQPNYKSNYYTCPHCNEESSISEPNNFYSNTVKSGSYSSYFYSHCESCYQVIIWENYYVNFNNYRYKLIYPKFSSAPIANEAILGDDLIIFNEARNIFEDSPKASAALLRSLLENLLRNKLNEPNKTLGQILHEKNNFINVDKKLYKFLVSLKAIGNDAAHSSKMIYDEDEKDDVYDLFKGVNLSFDRLVNDEKLMEKIINKKKE